MSGNNRYLNSKFYAKHPSFVKIMNSHSGVFNNIDTLLALSISHGALDSSKTKMELGKDQSFKWSGFGVCFLYLQFVFVFFIAVIKAMMLC